MRERWKEREREMKRKDRYKGSSEKLQEETARADSPPIFIQLYFSIINAYIVTFVNSKVSEGRTDE